MSNHYFAMMSRMKYINRWALMRNSNTENICEHSLEVAMLAHALCVIGNKRLGKSLDANKAAMIGLYHDSTEIITGDMPTPVKYYNDVIRDAFKEVEDVAANKLLNMLPEDLRPEFEEFYFKAPGDEYIWSLVKAADKLSALIKCIEELKMGNSEFAKAKKTLRASVDKMELPEVQIFIDEFLDSYSLTLDELK